MLSKIFFRAKVYICRQMKDIITRTLTGAAFIILIVGGLLINTQTALIVMGVFTCLGLWEFFTLLNKDKQGAHPVLGTLSGMIVFASLPFIWNQGFVLLILVAIPPFIGVAEVFRNKKNPIQNTATIIFSWFYIVLPLFLLVFLCGQHTGCKPIIAIGMLLIIWTNDTFAYLVGRFFGKHLLYERISPKKTWEGAFGGFVFACIMALAIAFVFKMDWQYWLIATLILAPSAILGDILESAFKRSLGVKDSGNILPGHGGILDRFDATLVATPLFFIFHAIYVYF